MNGINRTDEDWDVASARVSVVVSDRSVWAIGHVAFLWCINLVKVAAPLVEEVGEDNFCGAFNILHVRLRPNVVIKPTAFQICLSLEVLAAFVGIEGGYIDGLGRNDSTVEVTRFVKWRNQMDVNNSCYKTAMGMFHLASTPLNCSVEM